MSGTVGASTPRCAADSLVTIVVVPRERFSLTRRSLESLYERTTVPFTLVYVDGGSPRPIKRYLEAQARAKGFELIRSNSYLTPNQARNAGLGRVNSPYVVFVDNDVVFAPGWLDALVRCAEETGAWVAGPLYCIGPPEFKIVHMAGGIAHISQHRGKRQLFEAHRFRERPLETLHPRIHRGPCELVEFHCMLVRTEIFQRLGPLDESILTSPEHIDFCLAVREAGGAIYFEPDSLITYLSPPPFAWSDIPYYLTRWSDEWNRASLTHFRRKWNLPEDDRCLNNHYAWLTSHRQLALEPLRSLIRRTLGWRRGISAERILERALQRF